MNDVVKAARDGVQNCHTTGDIRSLSSVLFRNISDKSKANIFSMCDELLEQRDWAMGVIAYDFAYRVKKQTMKARLSYLRAGLRNM